MQLRHLKLEIFFTFSQFSVAFGALLKTILSRKIRYTNHIFFLIFVIGCYQIILNVLFFILLMKYIADVQYWYHGSSRPEVSCRKVCFEIFSKIHSKILVSRATNNDRWKVIVDRSSDRRWSVKKVLLKFSHKHLCRSLFFNKVTGWYLQFY